MVRICPKMKDLNNVSKQEQEDFFKSFDHILCDVDGVLWVFNEQIPGAKDAILSLEKLNKKVSYVSNNATKSPETYQNQLKSIGYDPEKNNLIIPSMAIVSYLQKLNFSQEIYLIGMPALRQELEKSGFKIAQFGPDGFVDSTAKFIHASVESNDNVGAVVIDVDVNLTILKLQRALTCLRKPEMIFISGGGDKKFALPNNESMIGPGYFLAALEDMVGRKSIQMAKPSPHFNDFIKEKCHIKDPNRVLFIGDSVLDDMAFATNCGYKKLLVFTGIERKNCLTNWMYPEKYKPDYYVDSLKIVDDLLNRHI